MAKLNEGVKFDEVAREYSEDKARQGQFTTGCCASRFEARPWTDIVTLGGSLGWKIKGSLDPTFEEAAFALEPSTTGSPKFVEVKTGFGYHIIMVSLVYKHHSETG